MKSIYLLFTSMLLTLSFSRCSKDSLDSGLSMENNLSKSIIQSSPTKQVIDLEKEYGVTANGLHKARVYAKTKFFPDHPQDTLVIYINEGTYEIEDEFNGAFCNLGNKGYGIKGTGRLIIQGAGKEKTTIALKKNIPAFFMKSFYGLQVTNMTLTRIPKTTTQGYVQSVEPGAVTVKVPKGFPSPLDVWQDKNLGHYLRKYTDTTDPQVIQENNKQIAYGYPNKTYTAPKKIDGNIWKIYLTSQKQVAPYKKGDLLGIKAKHEKDACRILYSNNIKFKNVIWKQAVRSVIEESDNITFEGCMILRDDPINGKTPCLSSNGGGLSIKNNSSNIIVSNCVFDSAGDDAISINGNSHDCKLINSTISNNFARNIYITSDVGNICTHDLNIINGPFSGKQYTTECDCE